MPPGRRMERPTSPEQARCTAGHAAWMREETAIRATIQATKPQPLAHALQDSPVGLAAWMPGKLHAWNDGGLSRDRMLESITRYRATGAVGSSRPCRALRQGRWPSIADRPLRVPVGYAGFHREMPRPPHPVAE